MKYALIPLFLILSANSFSQLIKDSSKINNLRQFLNEPINKFKDVIICTDAGKQGSYYSDTSTCLSYEYLPAKKNSINIGQVYFSEVFLEFNDAKTINNVQYNKFYISTDSISTEGQLNTDYSLLKKYLVKVKMKLPTPVCHNFDLTW